MRFFIKILFYVFVFHISCDAQDITRNSQYKEVDSLIINKSMIYNFEDTNINSTIISFWYESGDVYDSKFRLYAEGFINSRVYADSGDANKNSIGFKLKPDIYKVNININSDIVPVSLIAESNRINLIKVIISNSDKKNAIKKIKNSISNYKISDVIANPFLFFLDSDN